MKIIACIFLMVFMSGFQAFSVACEDENESSDYQESDNEISPEELEKKLKEYKEELDADEVKSGSDSTKKPGTIWKY